MSWIISSIGRTFRSLFRRRRKMAALPLPVAILDDLIPKFRFREWGHPRWRPEAEGPPFSAAAAIGIVKFSPGLGWRHFRRRHLGIKMAAPQVTSRGRWDSHEILRKGGPSPKKRPVDVWSYFFYFLRSIWSLASPNHSQNGWGSCPLATTGKSISLHVSTPRAIKRGVDFGKHLLYFFLDLMVFLNFFSCTLQ